MFASTQINVKGWNMSILNWTLWLVLHLGKSVLSFSLSFQTAQDFLLKLNCGEYNSYY